MISFLILCAALPQQAGGQWTPKVEIAWNRYND